jgi:hypothetical protein
MTHLLDECLRPARGPCRDRPANLPSALYREIVCLSAHKCKIVASIAEHFHVATDLITAVLLFGQFAQHKTRALLVLASGYLFDALIIIPHTMSFPGLFAPQGLMGSGPQTLRSRVLCWPVLRVGGLELPARVPAS